VSAYLAGELRVGDRFEIRGPGGRSFSWHVDDGGSLRAGRLGGGGRAGARDVHALLVGLGHDPALVRTERFGGAA
jgi:hypothetical protein